VVFLHEGLGSLAAWKNFPQRFCDSHGLRGLVFSRCGYGRSTPRPGAEQWGPDTMQAQAHELLPDLLTTLGIARPWLFGHSDGASIALLYAARYPVAGLVVVAPHIFVEDVALARIALAREAYESTDLRQRLGRYHADVDSAFRGWNDMWLDPAFQSWNIEAELDAITCPLLAVQGEDDEYGTLDQIRGIARRVPQTTLLVLADCAHSPHRDQPERLSREAGAFIKTAPSGA
jgi:pimeloyl-ACP methyl ester carboxylesterase